MNDEPERENREYKQTVQTEPRREHTVPLTHPRPRCRACGHTVERNGDLCGECYRAASMGD